MIFPQLARLSFSDINAQMLPPSSSKQATAAFYSFDAWLRNNAIGGWAELDRRFLN